MADMSIDQVVEELEAIPQTRERKMMLALAKHVRGDKPDQAKKGGQKKAAGQQPVDGDKGTDSEG